MCNLSLPLRPSALADYGRNALSGRQGLLWQRKANRVLVPLKGSLWPGSVPRPAVWHALTLSVCGMAEQSN